MLSDEEDRGAGQYIVYNNLVFPSEAEEGGEDETSYMKFDMKWEDSTEAGQAARASFTRINSDEEAYTVPEAGI